MANHGFVILLSFLLLLTTAAAETASPPPPMQPQQVSNIIDALIGSGDFDSWSHVLSVGDLLSFPLSVTLFVPSDNSLSNLPFSSTTTSSAADPFIIPYHIVPQRLVFSDLRLFQPLSRIPTFLPYKSILVTNTSASNFTLNDCLISQPDLYLSSSIAVHGIDSLLNYTAYGADPTPPPPDLPVPTPSPLPQPPPPASSSNLPPPPPLSFSIFDPIPQVPSVTESSGSCRRAGEYRYSYYYLPIPVILLIVYEAFGFKIYGNPFGD